MKVPYLAAEGLVMGAEEVSKVSSTTPVLVSSALEGTPVRSLHDSSVSVGRFIGHLQAQAKSRVVSGVIAVRARTRDAAWRLRVQSRWLREERPLTALAFVSGSAFLLGITLGVLRSRRS